MTNILTSSPVPAAGVRSRKRIANYELPPAPLAFDPEQLRLFINYVPPTDLKPPRRELRRYPKRAMERMKRTISQFGFLVPIIADRSGQIIVGHRRWLAAKDIGLELVPVIEVSHLSDEQLRLFTLLDNKLCEDGEWDVDELRLEFAELETLCTQFDLNIEDTGFSTAEIDNQWLAPTRQESGHSEDEVPELPTVAVTRAGDVWSMGDHRLICGNALEVQSYEALLGDERAQMVFSDAPYNLPAKTISGNCKHQHGDFVMASGEMPAPEFTGFLATNFGLLAEFSMDGSIHFQCMDFRHMREMLEAGHRAYSELKNLVVWKKHSAGMGSFYRSQHELIFVWKSGTASHINNFGLGESGRHRSNVWEYRGNAGFHRERNDELAAHGTVKPWSMVADAIRDCSKRGAVILDPFGGSGTTAIAAERTGRRARLIEIDPRYCDVAIRRWEQLTGNEAILAETGQTFAETEAVRHPDDEEREIERPAPCGYSAEETA